MKSDSYWSQRAAKRMYEYQKQADKIADEIAKAYISAANYINSEMSKIFRTFQLDGGLTEKEALELLNNLPDRATLDDLKAVLKKIKDPDKRRALLNIINSPAYAYRMKRLEQLQEDIDTQTAKLAEFEQAAEKEHYIDLTHDAFNRSVFEIQKGVGFEFSFAAMSTSRVEEVLRNNWSGKLFSARIWGRTEEINAAIKEELLVQFMTGRSYRKTAAEIETRMSVGAMEARRLVRTESTYIANRAELDSYKACGIKQYRYMATLDMRTSEICQSMDGKIFDVDDGVQGTNVPPLHPWCRSTTIPVIDGAVTEGMERSARDPITGKTYYVPADMTYGEWKKSIDERYGAGTWGRERKKSLYRSSDKAQYSRYKAALGKKNVPASFDKFQELKYNDTEGWDLLKSYKKAIESGELTPLADFKLYKEISEEIDKNLVGVVTKNGITVTGKSKHFIARTIGSVEQKRNGVSIEHSKQALESPIEIKPVRSNKNGESQKFKGDYCFVTVNPNSGILIQANPRGKRGLNDD